MATVAGNNLQNFLYFDLGILRASFYKHFCWQWPSDIRSMRVGCSRGSEEPLVLVSPYLEMLDFDLKVSCLLLTQQAPTYPEIQLLYTGSITLGEICYKVYWLATIDPCIDYSPENLLSLSKRLILMTYTTKVILPWSHVEVHWLAFLC
jgi:hypothetical protein